jgi:UDP-3-O-[3-hydroxymyristoyl] glucosamine N-acyltransferase LpxD
MNLSISSKDISDFIFSELFGKNIIVNKVSSIDKIDSNTISFINKKAYKFNQSVEALIIAIDGYEIEENSKCTFIFSSNPRLDFIKAVNRFFVNNGESKIATTAKVGKDCIVGENVTIGEYSVIKDNVTIGEGTVINSHVVVESNTIIGENCYIKSGAIIGEDGFGFERDEDGVPLRFSHIGNVVIGDNVEIGAKTTIARGALDSTVIRNNVKIDDQVFIAHNVVIGNNCLIAAQAEISGSVVVGNGVYIGPHATLIDCITIGNNAVIGIGAIVRNNVKENSTIVPFESFEIKDYVKKKKVLNDLSNR